MIKKTTKEVPEKGGKKAVRDKQPKQDYLNRMKDERVVGTTYVGPPFSSSPC